MELFVGLFQVSVYLDGLLFSFRSKRIIKFMGKTDFLTANIFGRTSGYLRETAATRETWRIEKYQGSRELYNNVHRVHPRSDLQLKSFFVILRTKLRIDFPRMQRMYTHVHCKLLRHIFDCDC